MSSFVRSLPFTAVAAALLGQTSIARADRCTERFVVDRPAATFNHGTASPGCAIFEAGVQIDHRGHGETFSFPLLFRVGLARNLELRATTDTVRFHDRNAQDDPSGEKPLVEAPSAGLGVKIMGIEADGPVPGMGVMATVSSVTNNRFVEEIGAQTLALFDWSFVEPLTLSVNPGLALTPAPDPASTRRSTFLLPASLTWTLPGGADWVSLYGEGFGFVDLRRDAAWTQSVGGGVAFRVRHWAQLDAGVAGEVTGDEHPISIFAGASVAF